MDTIYSMRSSPPKTPSGPSLKTSNPFVSFRPGHTSRRGRPHASTGACKGCHDSIDPIGFGLERFDRQGKYRTTDDGLPQCAIDGDGTVDGLAFNGATGLTDALLASNGQFEHCITTQLFRYASGRREDVRDQAFLGRLSRQFIAGDRDFLELVVELVSDDTFAFRRDEETL